MANKKIEPNTIVVFKEESGGVSIMNIPSNPLTLKKTIIKTDAGDEEIFALKPMTLEEIIEKDVPSGAEYEVLKSDDLPSDLTFRKAWILKSGKISTNMDMAREIHMKNIRQARNAKFNEMGFPVKLNPELEQAIISKDTRDLLQKLRDMPQNIDLSSAKTPEKLKAIWPQELN